MESKDKLSIGYFQAVGFLLLMPSFCFWALWAILQSVKTQVSPPEERIQEYLKYFPEFFRNTSLIFYFAAFTLILAIIFSLLRFKTVNKAFKVLAVITIFIGSFLLIFHISLLT
ncbi:MAG: hypothetical protein Q8933_05630 [Bacteroidota bacterium]|nr:hypothetical protein [Bacteroidota bacterium]MDP4190447.1 hypothetical protein [Bacteroidota bacterium]MDP4194179.1 hypothetical protein [Bacteroidota bacterium]